jgi:chromosome segregation ATPase
LIISNNIEIISDCCIRENKIINIKDNINQTINKREIINALKKIFIYQFETKKLFITLEINILKNIQIYLYSINDNSNEKNGNEPKIFELKNTNENLLKNINVLENKLKDEKNDNYQLNQKINELEKALNEKEKELNNEKIKSKDLTEKIKTLEIQLNDEKKYNLEFQKILNEKEDYLNKERKKTNDLNEKIKELENNTNINALNEKIIKLFEEVRQKEKELKEIKSLMPFEISKNEQ